MSYIITKDLLENHTKSIKAYKKIGVFLERNVAMISTIYSAFTKHITYVPLDNSLPDERINIIIKNSDLDCVITTSKSQKRIPECDTVIVDENDIIRFEGELQNNNIAYIMFTSGSTGTPKGVEVTYEALDNFMDGICESTDFTKRKCISCFTTFSFDIFFLESIMPLLKGIKVVLANEKENRNPKMIKKLITENDVDIVQMTPSRMQLLINHDPHLYCLKNVKEILIGGEAFPISILRILQKETFAKIYNVYGPTETTIWSSISDLTKKETIDIGHPIKNTTFWILDDNLNILPPGECGEICIGGKGLAKGYLNNESLTLEKFIYLPQYPTIRIYKTGDWGRCRLDGNFECLGRKDNQIKLRGHRIELEEIEFYINSYSGISQSIVAIQDDQNGLIAYYTSNKTINKPKLLEYLKLYLPDYMIPKTFKRIESFMYTNNDKIDRKRMAACNELFYNAENAVNNFYNSLSDFEKSVFNIISRNLSDTQTQFNEINLLESIDSITFIKIVVDLENEFSFEFDDTKLTLGEFPNIYDLIKYVEEQTKNKISFS